MSDDTTVLRWVGDIDLERCESVMAEVDSAVTVEEAATLILDLSDVGWVDSIGLGALIHARNRTTSAHMALVLRAATPRVKRLIASAGMQDLFTFDDPHPVAPASIDALPALTTGMPIADPNFDQIADLARTVLKTPVALFTQVDRDKQVMPGASGLDPDLDHLRSTPLRNAMCHHVVGRAAPVIVPDTAADPLFAEHPARLENGVVAYLGMPVSDLDGTVVGSMCVIDTVPRPWTDDDINHLRLLAGMCTAEMHRRTAVQRAAAAGEHLRAAHAGQKKAFSSLVSASLMLTDVASSVQGDARASVQAAVERVNSALDASRALVLELETAAFRDGT